MSGRCNKDGGTGMKWTSDMNMMYSYNQAQQNFRNGSDSSSVISSATNNERQITNVHDSVKERMKTLFETQRYADVIFYDKNNRGTSISAHKAILAVGSPLFHKMLYGESDQSASGVKLEVQISNLSFTVFSSIVKYLYTDEVFFENDSLVAEILDGAVKFGVQSLVDRCNAYLESIVLTDENVCSKLQISIGKKINALKIRCVEYIQKNTLRVINSPGFLKCSSNTVRTICKLQSLNLHREAELLEAVMLWVISQSPQNKQLLIAPLRKCIRFLTFTVTEFGDAIRKYPQLMTSDAGLKIMLHLYNPPSVPNFKSLPSWCNKNTENRCVYEDKLGNDFKGVNDSSGRIVFPLKPGKEVQHNIKELTCLLQMKCIEGCHRLHAIKLSFKKPNNGSSMKIFIKVHSSNITIYETLNVVWSEEVRVPFSQEIFADPGSLIDIEVEAKDITLYEFLQFDDASNALQNSHFTCHVGSIPKYGRLFFISEVEYGPRTCSRKRSQKKINI